MTMPSQHYIHRTHSEPLLDTAFAYSKCWPGKACNSRHVCVVAGSAAQAGSHGGSLVPPALHQWRCHSRPGHCLLGRYAPCYLLTINWRVPAIYSYQMCHQRHPSCIRPNRAIHDWHISQGWQISASSFVSFIVSVAICPQIHSHQKATAELSVSEGKPVLKASLTSTWTGCFCLRKDVVCPATCTQSLIKGFSCTASVRNLQYQKGLQHRLLLCFVWKCLRAQLLRSDIHDYHN